MKSQSARLFSAAFLASWIPILLSLPDAIDPESSGRVAVAYTRFYFSGLFVTYYMVTRESHERLLCLAGWLLAFWVIDGFIQLVVGTDIFGFDADSSRINSLFGDRAPKYGIMLAVLCPLLVEHARRRWLRSLFVVSVFGTVTIVLIAGTRSAWVMLAVIAGSYLALLWWRDRRIPWRVLLISITASALILGALYGLSSRFAARVDTAITGLAGRAETLNSSVSHRFFIWKGAIRIVQAHPVNGVGARGFRDAFPAYALADDPFLEADPSNMPTHSHQLVLELLAETGVIGLSGIILMLVLIARAGIRIDSATRKRLLPYGLCLIAAYFPINTHLAIYSSYWSQVLWWLTAVYCSGLLPVRARSVASN